MKKQKIRKKLFANIYQFNCGKIQNLIKYVCKTYELNIYYFEVNMSFMSWLKNIFKRPTIRKIEKDPNQVYHPLKLGLALSGGGTRGIAYIGVFKAFREAGIHFDYVAGTSVGSLMGAVYCADISVQEMEERAKTLRTKDILTSKISFMPNKTDKLEAMVRDILGGRNFADLSTPFTAVAVDIKSGNELRIDSGDLAKAITGSCAVPGIFNPVEFGDCNLYDGGLKNNIPADVVREMGADIVLAVDINPTRGYGTDSTKYLELMKAALRILMKSNSINGYVYSDYVLKVNLSQYDQRKLEDVEAMIQQGYDATMAEMPNILRVLGMRVPDENIKETVRRLKAMQKRAKTIAKEKKNKIGDEKDVLGQIQRSKEKDEASPANTGQCEQVSEQIDKE